MEIRTGERTEGLMKCKDVTRENEEFSEIFCRHLFRVIREGRIPESVPEEVLPIIV